MRRTINKNNHNHKKAKRHHRKRLDFLSALRLYAGLPVGV